MPVVNGAGYSEDTAVKQENFGYVLSTMMRVAASPRCMGQSWAHKEFLYFDLNAGPGVVDGGAGSPLIFLRHALDQGLPFHGWLFEREKKNSQMLQAALVDGLTDWHRLRCEPRLGYRSCTGCRGELSDAWIREHFSIVDGDHNETIAGVISDDLDRRVRKTWTYGLVYADPNGKLDLPLGPMRALAERLPKADQLVNVSATTYKRVRGAGQSGDFLVEDLGTVKKKHCMIRRPVGKWQWTMFLLTNWSGCPEFSQIGFRVAGSEEGKMIARAINFRRTEVENLAGPPYYTYGEYLRHPKFLAVRAAVFERCGGVCEHCNAARATEPHHVRYPPWGTFDTEDNLLAVCHHCHCEIHGKDS